MRLTTLALVALVAAGSAGCGASRGGTPRVSAASSSAPRAGWSKTTRPVRATASPARVVSSDDEAEERKVAMVPPAPTPVAHRGAPIVEKARAIMKGALPSGRKDCTGFVLAAYRAAGVDLEVPVQYRKSPRLSEQMYLWARAEGRAFKGPNPRPGDVVFFRDTYGTIKGDITHVALVESVESDGTIVLLHRMNGGLRRDKMSLARPEDPQKNGYLRKKLKAGEPTMAGQLFVAFGRFDGPI